MSPHGMARADRVGRVRATAAGALIAMALAACGPQNAAPHSPGAVRAQPAATSPAATDELAPTDAAGVAPVVGAAAAGPLAANALVVTEGLLNGGFEDIADATTTPPKAGAYWLGAFSTEPGVADDLIEERTPDAPDAASDGRRFLRLPVGRRVSQKIVADPRAPFPASLTLDLRIPPGGKLVLTLEDGRGIATVLSLPGTADHPQRPPQPIGSAGWTRYELDLFERLVRGHGDRVQPRLWLHLDAEGEAGLAVDVDNVRAPIGLEALSPAAMRSRIEDLVTWQLRTWLLPRDQGGLGLVDPATGYLRNTSYDVITGKPLGKAKVVAFHTIHRLLIQWLQDCERHGRTEQLIRWRPHLRAIVSSLLDHNFDPTTGLPRNVTLPELRGLDDQPVTVGAFVEFLLDARPLLDDPALEARTLAACRRTADTLVALQQRHDLDPEQFENTWKLDPDGTALIGEFNNWYGHIPNKLTPKGVIDTPRRFNTAWAVVTRRSFWYHVFKSSAAIMAVHALDPRPGDLDAVHRVVSLYQRDWDVTRYQLENDTDDHYGYLCEDVLAILRHSDGELTDALQLVQQATDARLERDGRPLGDTLWINGVRLGTPCAGDSPRAILGLYDLYALPDTVNPATSGLALYRDAILELAANDWKGRQLTNGQFTESFFKHWEMVCICYRGNVQDDCRFPPPEGWHGDVGDTFGGPPGSSIDAQVAAFAVANPDERPEILGRMATIMGVTEADLRREYGYLFGLDEAVARQYELPEKYTHGLSTTSPAGLGYVVAWARLLPQLPSH